MKSTVGNIISPRKRPPDLPVALPLHFCRRYCSRRRRLSLAFTQLPLNLLLLPRKRLRRRHQPVVQYPSGFDRKCFSVRFWAVEDVHPSRSSPKVVSCWRLSGLFPRLTRELLLWICCRPTWWKPLSCRTVRKSTPTHPLSPPLSLSPGSPVFIR